MKSVCVSLQRIAALFFVLSILVGMGVRSGRAADNELTIMSYNIHVAVGMDNQFDLSRIGRVIQEQKPDLVALQEVDRFASRSKFLNMPAELEKQTGLFATYAKARNIKEGGEYGIALLSKEKPLSSRQLELPGQNEQRALLIVEFEKYFFFCTHFDHLSEEGRAFSQRTVDQELARCNKPVFLAGDLNSLPDSSVIVELRKKWTLLSPLEDTWRADKPDLCIDYIFFARAKAESPLESPELSRLLVKSAVIPERVASDHLPIVVTIRSEAIHQ